MTVIATMIAVQAAAIVGTNDRYLISRLGALCFLLSTIEFMIPKPLPFLRVGLANIPIMLAITILPLRSFSLLVLIKIFGQALIGGTLFSWILLFSLAGTMASAATMYILKKLFRENISYIGICVAGAFASNTAQLVLATKVLFGESARLVAPPFILAGIMTGTILGLFANRFVSESRWFAAARNGSITYTEPGRIQDAGTGKTSYPKLVLAVVLIITLLFSRTLYVTACITFFSIILLLIERKRIRILPAVLTTAGIIFFNLFVPFGKVLAQPFSFPVTEGALLLGIKKALVLEGMLFLSRWALNGTLPVFNSGVMSDLFSFLSILTSSRKKIRRTQLVASIDDLMFEHG